jgi:hypothetical protein
VRCSEIHIGSCTVLLGIKLAGVLVKVDSLGVGTVRLLLRSLVLGLISIRGRHRGLHILLQGVLTFKLSHQVGEDDHTKTEMFDHVVEHGEVFDDI